MDRKMFFVKYFLLKVQQTVSQLFISTIKKYVN